ncbi:hypothetical protein Rmar_2907 (plasmid) [Rhodothermus marinus DSM 4252]|uniref:Uncharacterized protein n=1 Tax=Rhodothermus marinus (strain ATCC 43812 / DSM 4252 / R-10) TaxID=518766 RepID=D0MKV1_RHOM4|nr:hypothetical protein Rmar_2907 [Rhodothermus marinus DSM 4252]
MQGFWVGLQLLEVLPSLRRTHTHYIGRALYVDEYFLSGGEVVFEAAS